ncbi:hypothetical protein HDK77DRAFT_460505 [Phyllosticta capitalensis]
MESHNAAVNAIAAQVGDFFKRKETFRIYHGSTNSTRIVQFDPERMIDMSDFNHVLRVDRERQVAVVQANVPMDMLVEETLKHGLIPPVVMEFPGITTGGGYAGVAGESSSWKHGFFDRTVNWVDVVLLNGEIMRASPWQNKDLFDGAPGTYGTLCVTTLFEIQLIPAKEYVELEYVTVDSVPAAISTVQEAVHSATVDYIDGILFSPTSGTVMLGRLTDTPSSPSTPVKRFTRRWDKWFYVHAEKITKTTNVHTLDSNRRNHVELIPLVDYLFRYDRGAFWTGRYAFSRFYTPFNRVTRALLDPLMHTRPMYAALNASRYSTQYVIQDLALPFDGAEEFIKWNEQEAKIWPLWLCPLRLNDENAVPLRAKVGRPTYMLNIGVWGPGPRQRAPFIEINRSLERAVARLGGFKWLYANTYYTQSEFWRIYDRAWYDGLRAKYRAGEPWMVEKGNDVWEKTRSQQEGQIKSDLSKSRLEAPHVSTLNDEMPCTLK